MGQRPAPGGRPLDTRYNSGMDNSRAQLAWVFARRWAALLGLASMLYIVLGSLVFSEWWYGFFYNDGHKSAGYIWNGLVLLKSNFLPLLILTILALCAAVAAGVKRRRQLFTVTDKYADLMVLIAIVGVIAAAVVLYRVPALSHFEARTRSRTFRFGNGKIIVGPPAIEPPIYFRYLDVSRIDALYNQIEP